MSIWLILEKKSLDKRLRKCPKHVLEHYELWKRIVELNGPQGLKRIKGFHDESLQGEWRGYRSSRLSKQWRVIYKLNKQICDVYVVDINPHDYRR